MTCSDCQPKPLPFVTDCECAPQSFPFRCARHGCTKTKHFHRLCQSKPKYFALYETGGGPCLDLQSAGLGDVVARLIGLFVSQKVDCGCARRHAWLNRFRFRRPRRLVIWARARSQ